MKKRRIPEPVAAEPHVGRALESLEPRIVLHGDWTALEGAGVFASLAGGQFITATTIDLDEEPIVFEQTEDDGGTGFLEWSQVAMLRADDGTSNGENFEPLGRHSLAVHGERLIVGAPNANFGSGEVAIYEMDNRGEWVFQTVLSVPGLEAGDGFGWSVDIHGNTAVIGTRSGNAAYVFRDSDGWSLGATLLPTADQEGRFGSSVATDGSVIAVGAPGEEMLDGDATRTSGALYIFERDGNDWALATRMDAPESAADGEFGNAVAVHSNTVIVGAWLDDDMGEESGSAFAIGRHGGDWLVEGKFTPDSHAPGTRFGYDVAASGSRAAIVGSGTEGGPGESLAAVFKRRGDEWSREAILEPDGAEFAWRSAAFHGDRVVLGSASGGGAAHVFVRTGDDAWSHETTLTPTEEEGSAFVGFDVAAHDQTVVLGSGGDPVAVNAGAWVFRAPTDDGTGGGGGMKWIVRSLGTLPGVSDPLSDLVTWTDVKDGQTYAAVATVDGLMLFTRSADRTTWTVRNLTDEIGGAENIVSNISVFGERGNRVLIVGYNDEDELLIYRQPNTGEPGNWDWDFANITERDLRPQGLDTPRFVSAISSFATQWNALNITGLDSEGNVRAVWIAPGMEQWKVANLSANAGTPRLAGNIATFVTSWGAMNLAGVDPEGKLVVTWWVPGFERWVVSDFNALFGGPEIEPESVTAFTTSWGALNIVGRDERGDVVVYWWVPEFAEESSTDRWHISNLTSNIDDPELPVGTLRGLITDDGQINLFGTNQVNDVIRFFWEPEDRWRTENLTHTAEPA